MPSAEVKLDAVDEVALRGFHHLQFMGPAGRRDGAMELCSSFGVQESRNLNPKKQGIKVKMGSLGFVS